MKARVFAILPKNNRSYADKVIDYVDKNLNIAGPYGLGLFNNVQTIKFVLEREGGNMPSAVILVGKVKKSEVAKNLCDKYNIQLIEIDSL